jgi:hypothetical protein
MPNPPARFQTRRLALLLSLPLALACGEPEPQAAPAAEAPAAPAESAEIAALRAKFDPFQDFARAQEAGYGTAITSCWFHRVNGGQGIHYARQELIDSVVAPMDPELVMYEPQADGSQQLLAVEYIVPFDQWKSEAPPTAFGETFHRNEALSLWVLHAWLWRDNPSGLHSDWNPNVTCEHATESEDRADA